MTLEQFIKAHNMTPSKNPAAVKLGQLAAGKPKNYSAAELSRRKKRLASARLKRWADRKQP